VEDLVALGRVVVVGDGVLPQDELEQLPVLGVDGERGGVHALTARQRLQLLALLFDAGSQARPGVLGVRVDRQRGEPTATLATPVQCRTPGRPKDRMMRSKPPPPNRNRLIAAGSFHR
jgi:hypothetical protein